MSALDNDNFSRYMSDLVLPSVTTTIFTSFPFVSVNPSNVAGLPFPTKFLAADYSIVYDSPRYWEGAYWAIAMIFVYPVGIPLFYFWLLHNQRKEIMEFKSLEQGKLASACVIKPIFFSN